MHQKIIEEFFKIVEEHKNDFKTQWRTPLIAFADAKDEKFLRLKEIISPSHALPQDFLDNAETVLTYFMPFTKEICESNREGKFASEQWAKAYIETNEFIALINKEMKKVFENKGYESTVIPATHNFDEQQLISDWSHRHVAYIAGLGKFGINNMFITEKGCCGRVGSIVTSLKIEPTEVNAQENCLNKLGYDCTVCVDQCINGSLKVNDFDRTLCHEACLENADIYESIGLADVCGKCVVGLPCSYENPADKIGGNDD